MASNVRCQFKVDFAFLPLALLRGQFFSLFCAHEIFKWYLARPDSEDKETLKILMLLVSELILISSIKGYVIGPVKRSRLPNAARKFTAHTTTPGVLRTKLNIRHLNEVVDHHARCFVRSMTLLCLKFIYSPVHITKFYAYYCITKRSYAHF